MTLTKKQLATLLTVSTAVILWLGIGTTGEMLSMMKLVSGGLGLITLAAWIDAFKEAV
jgi:uncharacterized protein (DUF697 family)